MNQVFADTGYWIALLNPRDDLHQKAAKISGELSAITVTSQMVFAELLNAFSGSPLRRAAAKAVDELRKRKDVLVIPQSSKQFSRAVKRYEQAADKSWSLTDCASFLIMEEKQIAAALTYDRHFSQAGFQALLR